jgi:hypothetical protein
MQSGSGEGNVYPAPTLATIPIEMLEGICRFLSQKGVLQSDAVQFKIQCGGSSVPLHGGKLISHTEVQFFYILGAQS